MTQTAQSTAAAIVTQRPAKRHSRGDPKLGTPKSDRIRARDAEAWRLRCVEGLSQRQIGERLGIDRHGVWDALERARADLRSRSREYAAQERDVELAHLDELSQMLMRQARAIDSGAVDGDLPKVCVAYKVMSERKAKLLGLDAPTVTQQQLAGPNGESVAATWQQRLVELGWKPPSDNAAEILPGLPAPAQDEPRSDVITIDVEE